MKQEIRIGSDGNSFDEYSKGTDYFTSYKLQDLVTKTLVNYAEIQIKNGTPTSHDHRLIELSKRNKVTEGLLVNYIENRGIIHLSLVLTPNGRLDAYIGLINSQS